MEIQRLVELVDDATEVIIFFHKQYRFKAYEVFGALLNSVNQIIPELVACTGETVIVNLGLPMLLEAQEQEDDLLIADVLEGQFLPTLEGVIQEIQGESTYEDYDYLEQNLACVEAKDLRDSIRNAVPYSACDYAIEHTATGHLTVRITDRGRSFYLSGNNNPIRDAISFFDGNVTDDKYRYMLLGAGLFYEAEIMLRYRPDMELTLVEEDPYLLKLAFQSRDLSNVLHKAELSLACMKFADAIATVDEKTQEILVRRPEVRHMREAESRDAVERFFVKSMTIREQKGVLEKNFRKNMLLEPQVKSVDECRSEIYGKCVYFVAGGPSLDQSMHVLYGREEDSLVVAVGTVARKLIANEIQPEFVVVSDVSDNIAYQLEVEIDSNVTKLMYLCSANAKAVAGFSGEKYAAFQKGFPMAEEYAKQHGYTVIETGGSVSTTALDICIRFGAKKIVCLGLDLAYTGNKQHASETQFTGEIAQADGQILVKSVAGKMIPTARNLSSYHKWIERRVSREETVEFVNISDGAFIHGMTNVQTGKV